MKRRLRLWPHSLIGQTMAVVALALLIAQFTSAILLFRAGEQRQEAALINAAAFQLAAGPPRVRGNRAGTRLRIDPPQGADRGIPRPLRYRLSDSAPLLPGETRDSEREAALAELLSNQGIAVAELVVTSRQPLADPLVARLAENRPRARQRLEHPRAKLLVAGLRRQGAARWEVTRVLDPPPNRRAIGVVIFQTLVAFVVLVVLLWLALRRIARPLAHLTQRTERFAQAATPQEPLAPSGPDDIRRLIAAHNAMEARIAAMLKEKDVMLGAIGHDLKTPLAALRVRIEGVGDEAQRAKMAGTIEDITRMLDEMLVLARIGKSDGAPERADLSALAGSVVSEFEDMGEPVALETNEKITASVHISWLKRGLRNLVSNALRYGRSARVSVLRDGPETVLRIEDDGPGIPEARLAEMVEPFKRGEASRNRATGGAGLGLTIARAVAEQHGGSLVLKNRPEGGLRAEIRMPTA